MRLAPIGGPCGGPCGSFPVLNTVRGHEGGATPVVATCAIGAEQSRGPCAGSCGAYPVVHTVRGLPKRHREHRSPSSGPPVRIPEVSGDLFSARVRLPWAAGQVRGRSPGGFSTGSNAHTQARRAKPNPRLRAAVPRMSGEASDRSSPEPHRRTQVDPGRLPETPPGEAGARSRMTHHTSRMLSYVNFQAATSCLRS